MLSHTVDNQSDICPDAILSPPFCELPLLWRLAKPRLNTLQKLYVCILQLFQRFTIKNFIDKNVSKTHNYVMRKVAYRQSSSRGDETTARVARSEAQHE
jgi:hypothetical protein